MKDGKGLKEASSARDKVHAMPDQALVLHDVSWEQYRAVRKALDHLGSLRMTYLDGMLELVTPGPEHEDKKKRFARLIEIYAYEKRLALIGEGSLTLGKKRKKSALEGDESYSMGAWKDPPDFSFECVVTGMGQKKLEAYRRLAVPEVLFYEKRKFSLFRLEGDRYVPATRMLLLPELDLDRLLVYMNDETRLQSDLVRAFGDEVRGEVTPSGP